ncbi:MAG: hypothetical protein QM630_02835 [Microbacterium sp.]
MTFSRPFFITSMCRPCRALSLVPTIALDSEIAACALAVAATLDAPFAPAVAHPAGADGVTVVAPLPVAMTAAARPCVIGKRTGQIAHAIGVVVDFGATDIATGDTNAKRNMGVGTRHSRPPRVLSAPDRYPSTKDEPGLFLEPLTRSCPHTHIVAHATDVSASRSGGILAFGRPSGEEISSGTRVLLPNTHDIRVT